MSVLLWFLGLALAAPVGRVQGDLTLGMRAGVAGQWTRALAPHLEVGARLQVATAVYGGAPAWVREGLEPHHNLYLTPQAVVGVHTGQTAVSAALLLAPGLEVYTFRETRTVGPLREPVTYGHTGLRGAHAVLADLRVRPKGGHGVHLLLAVPVPLAPSGFLYIEHLYAGLGVDLAMGARRAR